jgi:hypothetical protein
MLKFQSDSDITYVFEKNFHEIDSLLVLYSSYFSFFKKTILVVLGIELRACSLLGKHSTFKPHPMPLLLICFSDRVS